MTGRNTMKLYDYIYCSNKILLTVKALRILCLVATAAICCAFRSGITVDRLQCEFLTDPLAVDTTEPGLSWKMNSSRNGAASSAYQILAATDPKKLNEQDADLWNSGKVEIANEIRAQ